METPTPTPTVHAHLDRGYGPEPDVPSVRVRVLPRVFHHRWGREGLGNFLKRLGLWVVRRPDLSALPSDRGRDPRR